MINYIQITFAYAIPTSTKVILLETPLQIRADKLFIEKSIKPSVNFVKSFSNVNGRLPNNREYYTWHRDYYKDLSSDLTKQVDSLIPGPAPTQYIRKLTDVETIDQHKFKNANWNKDFAIAAWRDDDLTEYYFSWSGTYDGNNYSWKDGFNM